MRPHQTLKSGGDTNAYNSLVWYHPVPAQRPQRELWDFYGEIRLTAVVRIISGYTGEPIIPTNRVSDFATKTPTDSGDEWDE